MALIVATLLLFGVLPFVLWPLIKTPSENTSPPAVEVRPRSGRGGGLG